MAKRHGNKRHFQVLLDPHRAALLEGIAAERGVRPSSLMRDLLYSAAKRLSGASEYGLAEAEDAAVRRQSIQNQVRARTGA